MNEIKETKNNYRYDMDDFATVDNKLQAAQFAIGYSSNLAQLALTYSYNSDDMTYYECACILSVIAQLAIDSAKRTFEIDVMEEIKHLKGMLNVEENGLPAFWVRTKRNKVKTYSNEVRREKTAAYKDKLKEKVNMDLKCPMNMLTLIDTDKLETRQRDLIDLKDIVIPQELAHSRNTYTKLEKLIEKYALDQYRTIHETDMSEEREVKYFLLMEEFEQLMADIRKSLRGGSLKSFFYWVMNRGMGFTPQVRGNLKSNSTSKINQNQVLLFGLLYKTDPKSFLECFVEDR